MNLRRQADLRAETKRPDAGRRHRQPQYVRALRIRRPTLLPLPAARLAIPKRQLLPHAHPIFYAPHARVIRHQVPRLVVAVKGAPPKRPIHPAFLNAFAFALQDFPGSIVKFLNGKTVLSSIITRTILDARIMQRMQRPSIALRRFGEVPMPLSAIAIRSLPPPDPSRTRLASSLSSRLGPSAIESDDKSSSPRGPPAPRRRRTRPSP